MSLGSRNTNAGHPYTKVNYVIESITPLSVNIDDH